MSLTFNTNSNAADKTAAREESQQRRMLTAHEKMRRQMLRSDCEYYAAQAEMMQTTSEAQINSTLRMTAAVGGILRNMAVTTTEMVGIMMGRMMAGAELSAGRVAATFMDVFGQMMTAMGSAMVAASAAFTALFSMNPAGILIGGLAMIAAGGIIKGIAAEMKGAAGPLPSGAGLRGQAGAGGGVATGSPSLSPLSSNSNEGGKTLVFNFYGDYMDPQKLAREVSGALGKYAGRSVPRIPAHAVG